MEKNFKDLLASMLADLDEGKSVEEIVTKKMKEANLTEESQAKVSEAVGYVDKLDAAKQNLDAALKKAVNEGDYEAAQQLQKLPLNSNPIRLHNRCKITGRPKGYMRQFGLSRIQFREMASKGLIPGVKKASW